MAGHGTAREVGKACETKLCASRPGPESGAQQPPERGLGCDSSRATQASASFTGLLLQRPCKNRNRRASEGLDSNLRLGARYLQMLTSLSSCYQVLGLDHLSSQIPFNISVCSRSEFPVFRNNRSS